MKEKKKYIYIYIYVAVTSIGGRKNGPNLKKIPSFIVENGQQKPPQHFSWRFLLAVFGFFFLNFFVLFHLFLLISCCFLPSWNPKTAHQMRLQAIWLYIYIYIERESEREQNASGIAPKVTSNLMCKISVP